MRKVVNFCDYFVICSGNTNRHAKAIADGVEEGLSELSIPVTLKEGLQQCVWIVYDTGDVVVHIFEKELREFYGLEHLWQEAKEVKWQNKKN